MAETNLQAMSVPSDNVEGRSSLGFSRSSGRGDNSVAAPNSKSGQSMVNPSSSNSRSRPSREYGEEKGDISIKLAMSNHDEIQDAIGGENFIPNTVNNEMFTTGSGFPLSKKSGN